MVDPLVHVDPAVPVVVEHQRHVSNQLLQLSQAEHITLPLEH
jgi:hypothetical protein